MFLSILEDFFFSLQIPFKYIQIDERRILLMFLLFIYVCVLLSYLDSKIGKKNPAKINW